MTAFEFEAHFHILIFSDIPISEATLSFAKLLHFLNAY